MKNAGLTAAKTVGDWVGIGKGSQKPELKASVKGGQPMFQKIENIKSISNTANLKSSEFYQEAKAGGNQAAKNLVNDILTDRHIEAIKERLNGVKNAIIAPVFAIEASGKNAIPNSLVWKIRQITGFDVDADISQSVKANHTNATREQRFLRVPEFEGDVQKGKNYILVDDVSTSGSTLKAMA